MKRLTGYNKYGSVYAIGMGMKNNEKIINTVLARLAAYEDTGLEPKEIETTLANYRAFLWHVTNGRMRKTNYTVEEMKSEANNCIMEMCNDCEDRQRAERYEDAEAEGRLVVFPGRIGDTFYFCNNGIVEIVFESFHQWGRDGKWKVSVHTKRDNPYWEGYSLDVDLFGKRFFLTREEAEEALRRKNEE